MLTCKWILTHFLISQSLSRVDMKLFIGPRHGSLTIIAEMRSEHLNFNPFIIMRGSLKVAHWWFDQCDFRWERFASSRTSFDMRFGWVAQILYRYATSVNVSPRNSYLTNDDNDCSRYYNRIANKWDEEKKRKLRLEKVGVLQTEEERLVRFVSRKWKENSLSISEDMSRRETRWFIPSNERWQ